MTRHLLFFLIAIGILTACQTVKPEPDPEKKARSAEIHYQLGIEAIRKNHLPKAFEELETALELAPDRSDILDAMGLVRRLRGDLKKSEHYYRLALRHDPGPRTYTNYGSLLLQEGKPKKAEKYFRKALEFPTYRHPDTAYINLGDALLAQGKFNEAIMAYRQATLLNEHQSTSLLREAEAFDRYHRPEFALAVYMKLLRKRPGSRPAVEGMSRILVRTGRKEEAIKELEHFMEITSEPMDRAWAEEYIRELSQR
jgi:type IV pilus biogenesis/stability protein PilW